MRRSMVVLALVAVVLGVSVQAGAAGDVVVHFVVVPTSGESGDRCADLERLKSEFIRLAGGYTELGPTNGASVHEAGVKRSFNISFLVAAKTDVSAQIKAFCAQNGGFDPFILTWQGRMP